MDYIAIYQNSSTELAHYGIKGQQHGVRRFQNEDGSLTPAGRERYAKYTYKTLDSSGNLAAVSGDFAKNELKRQAALKKAQLGVKVGEKTGHTTMAKAKLLAQRGKNAIGLAKDAMRLGVAAAKAYYNVARIAQFTDKLLKGSSNQETTNKDLQKSAKSATKQWAKSKTYDKVLKLANG